MDTEAISRYNDRDRDAIVYVDAQGRETRLTERDFSSKEVFAFWKSWSDRDNSVRARGQHNYENHTVPIEPLFHTLKSEDGAEEQLLQEMERAERQQYAAALFSFLRTNMKPIQFRRVVLYYGFELRQREIAALEHVSQQQISKSIRAGRQNAKKIIKRFLKRAKSGL